MYMYMYMCMCMGMSTSMSMSMSMSRSMSRSMSMYTDMHKYMYMYVCTYACPSELMVPYYRTFHSIKPLHAHTRRMRNPRLNKQLDPKHQSPQTCRNICIRGGCSGLGQQCRGDAVGIGLRHKRYTHPKALFRFSVGFGIYNVCSSKFSCLEPKLY